MSDEIVVWSEIIQVSPQNGALVYLAKPSDLGNTVTITNEDTRAVYHASVVEYKAAKQDASVWAAAFPNIPSGNYRVSEPFYLVNVRDPLGVLAKRITVFPGIITRMQ